MNDASIPDLPRLKAKLYEARVGLVNAEPFLGSLTLHLPVFIEPRHDLTTACVTSQGDCFFNPEFLAQLDIEEVRAVLLHETLHLALDAFPRQDQRHPVLWNIAHDHAVNLLIEDAELNSSLLAWPKAFRPLLDPAYRGMNAEAIYEQVVDSLVEAPPGWEGDVIRLPGCGGEGLDVLREKWRDALIEAAEEALRKKGWGDLPGWAQKLVGPLLNPQVPWQERLAQKLHGRLAGRVRTFAHPGRRSHAVGATLPGPRRNMGVLGVFVDVSGSVGPHELSIFLSELQGILSQVEVQVRLITWDATVQEDLVLEPGDDLVSLLAQRAFRITGGGGTDPRCVIRHLADVQCDLPVPSYGVLLTDGHLDWPQVEDWPLDLLVVTSSELPPPAYDAISLIFSHSKAH